MRFRVRYQGIEVGRPCVIAVLRGQQPLTGRLGIAGIAGKALPENYPVSAIHSQPTKTPFILPHSLPSKQNTAETICWNIQNTENRNT